MRKKNYPIVNAENADEICARIRDESGEDVQNILGKAHKERERMLLEAGKEAQNKKEAILAQADKEVERMKENIFSTINMEKKRITLGEKNRFIEDVILAVKKEAADFRADKGYPGFLKNAVLEGLKIVDSADVEIIHSSLDNNLITDSFKKDAEACARTKRSADISIEFKSIDFNDIGIMAQSKDGRVFFDNRFNARLKRVYEEIYAELLREGL